MEIAKVLASVFAVVVAALSFYFARRADDRSKKAEPIKYLVSEKETVALAALKLLREGLPKDPEERKLVISALIQACVFERSDRARALLYRVIELNRAQYQDAFRSALQYMSATFDSVDRYGFKLEELNLKTGRLRIGTASTVIENPNGLRP